MQVRESRIYNRRQAMTNVATRCVVLSALFVLGAINPQASARVGGWSARPGSSGLTSGAAAQSRNARGFSSEDRSRIRDAMSAVGLILVRNITDPPSSSPRPRGSAVVVRQDGIIVTNLHVIARDRTAELYDEIYFALPVDGNVASSNPYRLKSLLLNREMDLALLALTADGSGDAVTGPFFLPTIEIGDSRAVKELDDLVIIGYPEKGGSTVTVNSGTVEGKDTLGNWIKTNARLIHGNSGGAAVDSHGRLMGIPTKVIVDRQSTDRNGDGSPAEDYALGAVGFLRPAHLITAMMAELDQSQQRGAIGDASRSSFATSSPHFEVRGIVKSARDGQPIAGVAIGLVPVGTRELSSKNILAWGYTAPDGRFHLNRPVPPGHYTLQARTFGYEMFRSDVDVNRNTGELIVELRRSQ
jgi:S1-C subfamily serine protease